MEVKLSHKRRRYGAELKAQILAECNAPGASVAKVAMSHGINANILHGWRKLAREGSPAIDVVQREFVPVAVAPTPEVRARDERIEVELRRGALTMKIVCAPQDRPRPAAALRLIKLDVSQSKQPQRITFRFRNAHGDTDAQCHRIANV